jgi:hypothetical protein
MDVREDAARLLGGGVSTLAEHPYHAADPFWTSAIAESTHFLLIDAAQASGADRAWPLRARVEAHGRLVGAAVLEMRRERELRRVLGMLGQRGVPVVLMKGAALALTHYHDSSLRPRTDTDLLIRQEDVPRFTGALHEAGYVRAIEASGTLMTSQAHFDLAAPADFSNPLDVHWKIANPVVFSDALSADECLRDAAPLPRLGPHARALCPAHALLLACVHRVAHHQDAPDVLWLWDLRLLVSTMSASDLARFQDLAVRGRVAAVCAGSVTRAAERFDDDALRDVARVLRLRANGHSEPSAAFVGGGFRQIDLLLSDLKSLHSWRARVGLVREHVLPAPSYMRARYPRWPAALLPLAYAHRCASGAVKWIRRPSSPRASAML